MFIGIILILTPFQLPVLGRQDSSCEIPTVVFDTSEGWKMDRYGFVMTWWLHQMETFSALLALWDGNPPITGGFPSQRPVTRSFDVFFELRLNKRFSKQSRRRWFETPSRSLWRHSNDSDGMPISFSQHGSCRCHGAYEDLLGNHHAEIMMRLVSITMYVYRLVIQM